MELLVSRGHKLLDVIDFYPISTVRELAKAAYINRIHDSMTAVNAVAVGAVHAIEAGFSGKAPKVLRRYMDSLTRQIRATITDGKKDAAQDVAQDAETLMSGFGLAPTETRSGRRKNNP